MFVPAVAFSNVVIAIHVAVAVIAFGLVIVWPFISDGVERLHPGAVPALHRTRQQLSRLIVNPGLALMLISGIYLASDLHEWKRFFTQWGLGMVIVLGGLEGAVISRQEGKLADLGATLDGAGSAAAQAARTLSRRVSWLMAVLVLVTIYLMSVQA
ncbi:MAG TPA: hypothetical protein VFN48_10805 [Solirubrobacteraceae bacterium]|nr:hypothetical protein [Solirubrobacteraceae bacterium]